MIFALQNSIFYGTGDDLSSDDSEKGKGASNEMVMGTNMFHWGSSCFKMGNDYACKCVLPWMGMGNAKMDR